MKYLSVLILDIAVSPDLSVEAGHAIATEVRHNLTPHVPFERVDSRRSAHCIGRRASLCEWTRLWRPYSAQPQVDAELGALKTASKRPSVQTVADLLHPPVTSHISGKDKLPHLEDEILNKVRRLVLPITGKNPFRWDNTRHPFLFCWNCRWMV